LLLDDAIRQLMNECGGSKKLTPQSRGSEGKLSAKQSTKLELNLKTQTYLYVKDIIEHVKTIDDIKYSSAGIRNWLHRHGFSYKKPAIVPSKANQQAQKNWIAEGERK
jgi:transposase